MYIKIIFLISLLMFELVIRINVYQDPKRQGKQFGAHDSFVYL